MSASRRALLGFFAGLPFALKALASGEQPRALSPMNRERFLHGQWGGVRHQWSMSHVGDPRDWDELPVAREKVYFWWTADRGVIHADGNVTWHGFS